VAASRESPAQKDAMLERFIAAVRTVAPDATGAPISIQESARTILHAFIQAGVWALIAITVLLVAVLRRVRDVAITLASLLLGGLVTLALCVVLDIPLNYENIIALPLLFGIGVAFNIYFVIAWRNGRRHLLQTSLARAIVFSALTTATAFGSLWLSSHPGTASMGKLLALSLACTLAAALVVLPALLTATTRSNEKPA
jgi:predicted RND superfamily exporter protein